MVVCGVSDLAEIVILQASQAEIVVKGIYDPKYKSQSFMNMPVWTNLSDLPKEAICIVTALDRPQRMHKSLLDITTEEQILMPEILQI